MGIWEEKEGGEEGNEYDEFLYVQLKCIMVIAHDSNSPMPRVRFTLVTLTGFPVSEACSRRKKNTSIITILRGTNFIFCHTL